MGRVRMTSGVAIGSALVLLGVAACSDGPPPDPPAPTVTAGPTDRDQLAAAAAAAKDRRYVATYRLTSSQHAERTVTVAVGNDGSWVVAIPAGALSGLADIAIFRSADGLFQCALGPAAGTAGVRPDLPVTPGCAKVSKLSKSNDPRVQHIFTDWIDPLIDRASAISVATTKPLPGATGTCFSLESNSAALAPPVDPGVYCYDATGILTAAKVGFGTLVLRGAVAAAPPSVAMPAPIVNRPPLSLTAPAPPPSPTTSASTKPQT